MTEVITPVAPVTPAPFDINSLQGPAFHALMPEDVRDKPYMKDVNNFNSLVKGFAGAQSLLGKPIVPGENATPEEWNQFFNKAGRPEKVEGYVIPEIEGVPKEFVDKATEVGILKQLMHQSGMSVQQAKVFMPGFLKAIYTAEMAEKTEADTKFNKVFDGVFGADKQAIMENGKKFLAEELPDTVKPFLNDLDEKALAIIISATDAIFKKHIQEDGFKGKGTPPVNSGGDTKDSIQAQMRAIMSQPEYADPFKNKTKNAELNAQMNDLRGKLKIILK